MRNQIKEMRDHMIEKIAETDDELTMKYLEADEISSAELKAALRKAVISGEATPVFCGSSLRNKGVQPLLDAVIDYLPSPQDVPPVKGIHPKTEETIERPAEDDAPWSSKSSLTLMLDAWHISGFIRVNSARGQWSITRPRENASGSVA